MIVDSSALVALLKGEPDAPLIARTMLEADRLSMSVANWLEVAMVTEAGHPGLDDLVAELGIELVAFDLPMARLARGAFQRYGRGTRHPARLNFGDCMAYALARSTGEPLLFKGDDVIHTDLTPALN